MVIRKISGDGFRLKMLPIAADLLYIEVLMIINLGLDFFCLDLNVL